MKPLAPAVVTLLALSLAAPAAAAGDSKHTLVVYFMGAGMDGTTAIGDLEADVNVGFSDIMENLEFGAMAAYRLDLAKWAFTADAIYMGLGATKDGSSGFAKADVDFSQAMLEVDGVYKHTDRFEVLFGLRYNELDGELVVTSDLGNVRSAEGSQSWVDPLVGVRWIQPIGKQWAFIGRADVGGFGVGSDFAWQALALFDWQSSKTVGVLFGIRALDVDYDDGEGSERFVYDVLTAGPVAGMTIKF